MKKIFFAIILFFITFSIVNANMLNSSISWSANSWSTSCPSINWNPSFHENVEHKWVPSSVWNASLSGSIKCHNHTYYDSYYTRTYSNNSWITACNTWDLASINWNTVRCQRWDDTAPDVNITNQTLNWPTNKMAVVVHFSIEEKTMYNNEQKSWIKKIEVNNWSNWSLITHATFWIHEKTSYTWNFNFTWTSGTSWTPKIIVTDHAWNKKEITWKIIYFDDKKPEVISMKNSITWWTNIRTVNVAINFQDIDKTWVKSIEYKTSKNWPTITKNYLLNYPNTKNDIFTYNYTWLNWERFRPCVRITDWAWNVLENACSSNETYFDFDKIDPDNIKILPEDDNKNPNKWKWDYQIIWEEVFYRAGKERKLYITIDRKKLWVNWAWIDSITWTFDWRPVTFKHDPSCGSQIEAYEGDISCYYVEVDIENLSWRTNANGYTTYDLKITGIRDKAWNESNFTKTFTYNVYADYIDSAKSSIIWVNFPQIANWNPNSFTFDLKDKWWNPIIPVKTSSWWIVRDLNFSTYYDNSLYLDQYKKVWVWITTTWYYNWRATGINYDDLEIWQDKELSKKFSTPILNNGTWVWNYWILFKSYSPTYLWWVSDWRQYANWNFTLKQNITVKLSDASSANNLINVVDFQFKPKFYTEITWDLIDNWIVVWAKQESVLELIRNDWTLNWAIYLEYGFIDDEKVIKHQKHENFDLTFEKISIWRSISSWVKNSIDSLTSFGNIRWDLNTILYQKWRLSTAEQNTYLATFIKDIIGWRVSVYPSFVYWMDRYHWTVESNNTFQKPLKIIWSTHSLYYSEVVEWDSGKNVSTLWNIEKSEMQKNVRKNVSENFRNLNFTSAQKNWMSMMNLASFSSSSNPGWIIIWDTAYFLKEDWSNVDISWTYEWVKNLVIYGWNAYIKSNILARNNTSDILSIIVLEKDWKGWDIFIDNRVTKIEAVLYADKSLLTTSDWKIILSAKNGWTYNLLKDQLHIYGTVFSNNTIWGSISLPKPICPYYVKENCDEDKAQEYDLYNFRRWYENILESDKKTLKSEYAWKDVKYPLIIEYNPIVQQKNLKFFQIRR